MCTVTYLPLSESDFILTSNRDEKTYRESAVFPYKKDGLVFPKDGRAGGSWIVSSQQGKSVCLLNGAFEKHDAKPPYRTSRGQIVLSVFDYSHVTHFAKEINLDNIEPFTLILIEHRANTELYELRWDGVKKHFKQLETNEPHFWCSSTLYSKEVASSRKAWFDSWKTEHPFTVDHIYSFHRFGGSGDLENDLTMDRGNGMQTISITSISKEGGQTTMNYHDLLTDKKYVESI